MQLSKEDQRRFPGFYRFLSVTAPRLAATRVVAEMADLTNCQASKIRHALSPGSLPKVVILETVSCSGSAAGCFRSDKPDRLEVLRALVAAEEKGVESLSGWVDRSIQGIKLRKSHVTVLHELVHWADFKAHGRFTSVSSPYHDLASKWEWLVFAAFDQNMVHRSLQ